MAAQGVSHWMRACAVLLLCLSEALPAAPETSRNYYETLSVEPTATDRQIKKAFRKLAVKYHPDKNKSAGAEKTFREIAEAYTVLSSKEKRKLYDSLGHEAFLKHEADAEDEDEPGFTYNFADLFHNFDDSLFMEEPHFHWTSHEDTGNEEHYTYEAFTVYFADEDEN